MAKDLKLYNLRGKNAQKYMQEICNIDKKQFVTFSNSMMKNIACISLQLLQETFLKNKIAYACVNSYKKLD